MEKNIDIYNIKENCNVKAKIFYTNEKNSNKHFFIFCHGFCSGKDSNSVKVIANKLLQNGVSSISFDFPGHSDSIQGTDKLNVEVCSSYIDSVVEYLKSAYGNDVNISFFAISFGAYILLNKLIGDNSEYKNIFLRSPAINMKEIFVKSLLKDTFEQYKKNRRARSGHGGKIEVPYSFYEDLINNNLYDKYHEKRNIVIIQGTLDDTAPIEDTYKFIGSRPEIELIEMKNMKHHMEIEELEIVAKKVIEKIKTNKIDTKCKI